MIDATEDATTVARRYMAAYGAKDFATVRSLLNPTCFQFSHHNRRAYAADAVAFVAMLERMAAEVFPDRRFTHIRGLHVVDDVVLVDAEWKATPIVTIEGRFQAGVELVMRIKSMLVVERGLITEIRDHNS